MLLSPLWTWEKRGRFSEWELGFSFHLPSLISLQVLTENRLFIHCTNTTSYAFWIKKRRRWRRSKRLQNISPLQIGSLLDYTLIYETHSELNETKRTQPSNLSPLLGGSIGLRLHSLSLEGEREEVLLSDIRLLWHDLCLKCLPRALITEQIYPLMEKRKENSPTNIHTRIFISVTLELHPMMRKRDKNCMRV